MPVICQQVTSTGSTWHQWILQLYLPKLGLKHHIYIYNVVSSYYIWGMVYYIVTEKLKRRPKAMIGVFLSVVKLFCFLSLVPGINLMSLTSLLVTHTRDTRSYSQGSSISGIFFPQRHIRGPEGTCPHNGPCERVCVCVHVRASCLCEKYIFHYQTLFSVLNGAFFPFLFSFGGDYRNHFKAKPCLLLLFLHPCLDGALRIQSRRSSRWSALFLSPGPGRTLGGSVGNEASIIYDLPHPLSRSVPTLRLSQAWRKLIVPTLCSTAHQTPVRASPVTKQAEKTSPSRGRGTRGPRYPLSRMCDLSSQGLKSRGLFLQELLGLNRAEGGRESWWLREFSVIAMGIGKGTWLICLMNYASPLRAALPASKLYYSHCLNLITSPLLALKTAVQQVSSKAFGAWSLGPSNRVLLGSWQNDWNRSCI